MLFAAFFSVHAALKKTKPDGGEKVITSHRRSRSRRCCCCHRRRGVKEGALPARLRPLEEKLAPSLKDCSVREAERKRQNTHAHARTQPRKHTWKVFEAAVSAVPFGEY